MAAKQASGSHVVASPGSPIAADAASQLKTGAACVTCTPIAATPTPAITARQAGCEATGEIIRCLPVGLAAQPSVATGTVMRRATFAGYAQAAGFQAVDEVPIANDFYRFYRLTA
jgi:hypothetical protein